MNKASRLIKRYIALLLVLLFSIESFAAVVGDNDGAAFITKAEFDSMKNDFQDQLDRYNSSLDNKINGAIAAYLSGIAVRRRQPVSLDRGLNYSFPLVMCGDNQWNSVELDYYNVSIPKMEQFSYQWYHWYIHGARVQLSDNSMYVEGDHDLDISSVPQKDSTQEGQQVFASGLIDNGYEYPGQYGSLNIVSDQGERRVYKSASHTVFSLTDEGWGKFHLLAKKNVALSGKNGGFNGDEDDSRGGYPTFRFIGLATTNFNWNAGADITMKASATRPIWSSELLPAAMRGYNANETPDIRPNQSGAIDDILADFHQKYVDGGNTGRTSWVEEVWPDRPAFFDRSKAESCVITTEWDKTSSRKYLYYGDAYMPANKDSKWGLIANPTDQPNKYKIVYFSEHSSYPKKWFIHKSIALDMIRMPTYTAFELWPEWQAKLYTSYDWETSDNFSALPAALVMFYDSTGEKHYFDEGLYLGKFDADGSATFRIKFNGTAGTQVHFAISKKPFGWDANVSDREKFLYYDLATPTNKIDVGAGGDATVTVDTTYQIEINDINAKDKLYMIWYPDDSDDYIELDSLTDFYYES
ncbi:MAG: hypothetical protein J6O09_01665 [Lachnospiraceae bacterium]|nr:hypothetical protein [Lachnospiraceae bacterium]